jgi:hypothetical protein
MLLEADLTSSLLESTGNVMCSALLEQLAELSEPKVSVTMLRMESGAESGDVIAQTPGHSCPAAACPS